MQASDVDPQHLSSVALIAWNARQNGLKQTCRSLLGHEFDKCVMVTLASSRIFEYHSLQVLSDLLQTFIYQIRRLA